VKYLTEIPLEVIKSFAPIRKRIQKAINKLPKKTTLKQAKKQVEKFKNNR
jgi:hypothetical protein